MLTMKVKAYLDEGHVGRELPGFGGGRLCEGGGSDGPPGDPQGDRKGAAHRVVSRGWTAVFLLQVLRVVVLLLRGRLSLVTRVIVVVEVVLLLLVSIVFLLLCALGGAAGLLGLHLRQVVPDVLAGGVDEAAVDVQAQDAGGPQPLGHVEGEVARVAAQVQDLLPLEPLGSQQAHAGVLAVAGIAVAVVLVVVPKLEFLLLLLLLRVLATPRSSSPC